MGVEDTKLAVVEWVWEGLDLGLSKRDPWKWEELLRAGRVRLISILICWAKGK